MYFGVLICIACPNVPLINGRVPQCTFFLELVFVRLFVRSTKVLILRALNTSWDTSDRRHFPFYIVVVLSLYIRFHQDNGWVKINSGGRRVVQSSRKNYATRHTRQLFSPLCFLCFMTWVSAQTLMLESSRQIT